MTSPTTNDPGFYEDHLTGNDPAGVPRELSLTGYTLSDLAKGRLAVQVYMCHVRQETPRHYPASRLGKHPAGLSATDVQPPHTPTNTNARQD